MPYFKAQLQSCYVAGLPAVALAKAGADYYPFGLTMSDREITTEPYRFGYQGQYSEEESETGWNSFDLRMYDARFGRWLSPDPYGQFASPYVAMGNNPVISIDPDGGLSLWKWVANPTSIDNMAGYWARTALGKAVDASAYVGLRMAQGAYLYAQDVSNFSFNDATTFVNGIVRTVPVVNLIVPEYGGNSARAQSIRTAGENTGYAAQAALMSRGGGGFQPSPRPVFATPNGSIPVTMPVVVPTVKATNVHGQVFAKKPTPDTNPGDFTKLKGDQGYVHKKTGEIYRKSYTSHGNQGNTGKQWKVYPKGTTDFSKQTGLRTTIL